MKKLKELLKHIPQQNLRQIRRLLSGRKKAFVQAKGDIRFFSQHKILSQLADEIIKGLPDISHGKVNVFVGAHHNFDRYWHLPGLKVSLQTEHYFDENGNALFGSYSDKVLSNIEVALTNSDIFLDLSAHNEPFYLTQYGSGCEVSKHLHKLRFGPHIFPDSPVSYNGNDGKAVFFGHVEAAKLPWRSEVLDSIDATWLEVIEGNTYGEQLYDRIDAAGAVLNVHAQKGVYTEVPRLLTAYLRGKTVVSDTLDSSFVEGVDYIPVNDIGNQKLRPDVFDNFSKKVTEAYSFSKFLMKNKL